MDVEKIYYDKVKDNGKVWVVCKRRKIMIKYQLKRKLKRVKLWM